MILMTLWTAAGQADVQAEVQADVQARAPRNIDIFAGVDLVHPISLDNADQNKLTPRSAELSFFGPIDHIFDGNLTFAGHTEEGEFHFEIHEGFVSSSKLIPRSRFKIGKFFLGVGRLNQFHQHDWPFTSAPKVQREFFSPGSEPMEAEGAADTGFEYSILLPIPFYLDITAGVTNGYCYGHCHGEGRRPPSPLYYIRPATYIEFDSGRGAQIGLNYLSRKDFNSEEWHLVGVDATYKERQGKTLKWLLQSEIWHRSINSTGGNTSTIGAYVYPQYGFNEELSTGLRLDAYSQLNKSFETTGEHQKDFDYAIVPTLAYKPSEFSTLRLSYSHEVDTTQGLADVRDRRFELQLVYLMGAHPAHDF